MAENCIIDDILITENAFEKFLMDDEAIRTSYDNGTITNILIDGAEKYPDIGRRIVEVAKSFFSTDIENNGSNRGDSVVFLKLIKNVSSIVTYQDFAWAFNQIQGHGSTNFTLLFEGFAEYCAKTNNAKEVLKFWDDNFPTKKPKNNADTSKQDEYKRNKRIMKEYWDIVVCNDKMFWYDDVKFYGDRVPICKDKKALREIISRGNKYERSFKNIKASNKIYEFPKGALLTFLVAGLCPLLILMGIHYLFPPVASWVASLASWVASLPWVVWQVLLCIVCGAVYIVSFKLADELYNDAWVLLTLPALIGLVFLLPYIWLWLIATLFFAIFGALLFEALWDYNDLHILSAIVCGAGTLMHIIRWMSSLS